MTFEELYKKIQSKAGADPVDSNSAKYLALGTHEIGKKLLEEAAESWMAAEHESKENAATEISQLLYWAALLGVSIGLNAKDIEDKL